MGSTSLEATPKRRHHLRELIGDEPWSRFWVVVSAFAVLVFTFGAIQIARLTMLSAYDEAAHLDYAWKVAHGQLPFPGSLLSPETLDSWSCRGQHNLTLPACGSAAGNGDYPARGENYLMHPPVFYAVSGAFARAVSALGIVDFADAARFASLIWLLAGMVVLYAALLVWRMPWKVAAPVVAIIPSIHMIFQSSTTVNNDASAVFAGGLAVYALGRALKDGRYGFLFPTAVTFVVASLKVLNAIPMIGVAGALIVAAALNRGSSEFPRIRQALFSAAGIVGATLLVNIGWNLVRSATKTPGWVSPNAGVNSRDITGLPFDEWVKTVFSGMTSIGYGYVRPDAHAEPDIAWTSLLSVILLVAPFVVLVVFREHDARWYIGAAAVGAMLALPASVQLQTYLASGGTSYFPGISMRYGLSTVPLLFAAASVVVHERRWTIAAWVTAGAAVVVLAYSSLFA
ncbi:hypothetical protein ACGGZK_03000 [Agromyces sp. MMS24-K17]|uniref:hypothetical protein n=1 Tax=Agromyces sp. MMS24-K17 TaxID=3372850 RepID=UPI00375540AC